MPNAMMENQRFPAKKFLKRDSASIQYRRENAVTLLTTVTTAENLTQRWPEASF